MYISKNIGVAAEPMREISNTERQYFLSLFSEDAVFLDNLKKGREIGMGRSILAGNCKIVDGQKGNAITAHHVGV